MSEADGELRTLRLSTAQFSDRDAVEAFRETFGRTILRIDMEPLQGGLLEADMTLRGFAGVGMATGRLSPMRNRHTTELIDSDDLVLVFVQSGVGVLEQRRGAFELTSGQVVLTASDEPATFTGLTPTCVTNFRLSRAALAPHLADLGSALLDPILKDSVALRILKNYAELLNDERTLETPALRRAVASHVHDLALLAIGANRDAAAAAVGRGVAGARLLAIKADIAAHLSEAKLSAPEIAARHGISARYVRMLLENDNTNFSEFVLGERLQRAHSLLIDPQHTSWTISSIAFECGFSDLSYFNRTFRRRFGKTPSDVRNQFRNSDT
jgi:AraC-like DNA-binding protein